MNSRDLIEKLLDLRPAATPDSESLRHRFEALHGTAFPTDSFFEERMFLFLEWYLCDSDPVSPPLVDILERIESRELRDQAAGLLASHRSLFELMDRPRKGRIWLRDVIGGGEWNVLLTITLPGFEVGDQVDARLRISGSEVVFGAGFVFHPPRARERIHHLVARWRTDGMSRLDQLAVLARLHILSYRFSHIPVERIYSEEGIRLLDREKRDG